MALYDGLPLDTPTEVYADANIQIWATRTANGGTVEGRLQGAAATAQANLDTIVASLQQAVTYFGGNYANWSTLTNAQKDAAAKNAQQALGRLARYLLGQFDAAG